MQQNYRDLKVWQRAIDLTPEVYSLLKRFPKEENYALSDQIRRAVVSIAANIAEGQGRQYAREFIQFLAIARGSLAELDTLFVIAERLGYLTQKELESADVVIGEIRSLLYGLTKKLQEQV